MVWKLACLKINITKTEYMKYNISVLDDSEDNSVKIRNDVVAPWDKLRYLRFIIESKGHFRYNEYDKRGVHKM